MRGGLQEEKVWFDENCPKLNKTGFILTRLMILTIQEFITKGFIIRIESHLSTSFYYSTAVLDWAYLEADHSKEAF